jgi:hypothetical protein
MLKAAGVIALAVLALLGSVTSAPAISIFSSGAGDGFGTLTCIGGTGCPAEVAVATITPDPSWQPPTAPATWVSYNANHGTTGPANDTNAIFQYAFSLSSSAVLSFTVFADDTAGVSLDGTSLIAPTTTLGAHCANAPVGCMPGHGGQFLNILLAAGDHALTFDTIQLGGSGTPFGMLMSGELTATPEPATILLLGSVLTAAGVFSRRRFRKK